MEQPIRTLLKVNEAQALDDVAQKLKFLHPKIPFLCLFFVDTDKLKTALIEWLKVNIPHSFAQWEGTAADFFVWLQDHQNPELLLINLTEVDVSSLHLLNIQRDKFLNESKKIIFICPQNSFQDWYEYAYDTVSRMTGTYKLHDYSVFHTENAPDFAIRDKKIEEIEYEFLKIIQKEKLSEADYYRLYQLADKSDDLSAYQLGITILDKILHITNQSFLASIFQLKGILLRQMGRLDEAMGLHKKEEKIKEELGDKQGLARSFGNQALILKAWGRLDEAMGLHKKEEKICEELGDKQGLANCFGNQALILSAWGRLDEAMGLHKKEEKICEELGDKQGLLISYVNQAVMLTENFNQTEEGLILLQKAITIAKELKSSHIAHIEGLIEKYQQ